MSIERLKAHYGFSRMPFSKDLAPQMLFSSGAHKEAVARISWLVSERAIGVVSGEVGSGKSVAARAAAATMDSSRHTIIYISNPTVGARGIYTHIVSCLGGTPRFQRASLVAQVAEHLEMEDKERAKRIVLIVDEGHLLSSDQLEQLRILTNFEMDSVSPLALVLLGQPALRRRLKLGSFAALDQRIALRFHMEGMPLSESAAYVKHHLGLAGRSDNLFSDDAVAMIHQTSRGFPRAINNLAIQALIAAFAERKAIVDEACAKMSIDEVTSE